MTSPLPIHPAVRAGQVAVITGGASGIGLAAARRLKSLGMQVLIADLPGPGFEVVRREFPSALGTDVAKFADMQRLAAAAAELGDVTVLMNNAGIGRGAPSSWEDLAQWQALLNTNLWGVIHGVHAFAPAMISRGERALIINTGSKQGITLPPGNAAYNLSKAGVKAYTETLAHELRGVAAGAITAHLLIPGFTYTGMSRAEAKPASAWMPEQVVEFMFAALARDAFYILCPDNDVTRDTDEKRILWAARDIIENRPALSRWHADYAAEFAQYMSS